MVSTAPAEELCSIGRAAGRLGISPRALRYYEQVGLLAPAGHTTGGHRLYGPDDLARVSRIRELQELMGFNLDEIRDVLAIEDRLGRLRAEFHATTSDDERTRIADEALAHYASLRRQIDDKLSRLTAFRDEIDEREARARKYASASES